MFISKKKFSMILYNFGVCVYKSCGVNLSLSKKAYLKNLVNDSLTKGGRKWLKNG